MVVSVIRNSINYCSFFSYVYQSITFQGIINSILKGKGGRKEDSKQASQGMSGSIIPSRLYQTQTMPTYGSSKDYSVLANSRLRARKGRCRQEPNRENDSINVPREAHLLECLAPCHQEFGSRQGGEDEWEHWPLSPGCSCPLWGNTATLTLLEWKVVRSCLQASPEGIVRVWKRNT